MKAHISDSAICEITKIFFIVFLIAAGSALLVGSRAGIVSLDHIAQFWPVTLVATGLAELLMEPERNA